MSKPTIDRNAGADAVFRGVARLLTKRQKQFEKDGLLNEAYVLIEAKNLVKEYRARASRRKGGIGRK